MLCVFSYINFMIMGTQKKKSEFSLTFLGVQAVEKVTTREIGISCNLLPAPPLGAQPINVPTLDESFATEETDSIQDEVEDPDESFQSIESDDTDGSDLG